MTMFLSFWRSWFASFSRSLYWYYNALRIKAGSKPTIGTPFMVEGKGKISLGDYVVIKPGVTLGCEVQSSLAIGNNCKLGRRMKIILANKAQVTIGAGSSIQDFTLCMAHNNWTIGSKVSIAGYCQLFSREHGCKGKFIAGDDTHIGDYTIIDVSDDVTIGKAVAIGPRCTIYTHDHNYRQQGLDVPWKGDPVTKPVTIEDGAWIGSNVTILPGITVGQNSIIAAGSVITKDVPAYTICAGIPAKVLKSTKPVSG